MWALRRGVAVLAAVILCGYHLRSVSGLPDHEPEGVLPPYVGGVLDGALQSPYDVTATEIVERYGITEKRRTMLRGLFEYRAWLRSVGVTGFQWIDGSFVDLGSKIPGDIDVVTFFRPPVGQSYTQFLDYLREHRPDLLPGKKTVAGVHIQVVELEQKAENLVWWVQSLASLFSHQRESNRHRGFISLELDHDDGPAIALLALPVQS